MILNLAALLLLFVLILYFKYSPAIQAEMDRQQAERDRQHAEGKRLYLAQQLEQYNLGQARQQEEYERRQENEKRRQKEFEERTREYNEIMERQRIEKQLAEAKRAELVAAVAAAETNRIAAAEAEARRKIVLAEQRAGAKQAELVAKRIAEARRVADHNDIFVQIADDNIHRARELAKIVDQRNRTDASNNTPLHKAVEKRQYAVARSLLQYQIDRDFRNDDDRSALELAGDDDRMKKIFADIPHTTAVYNVEFQNAHAIRNLTGRVSNMHIRETLHHAYLEEQLAAGNQVFAQLNEQYSKNSFFEFHGQERTTAKAIAFDIIRSLKGLATASRSRRIAVFCVGRGTHSSKRFQSPVADAVREALRLEHVRYAPHPHNNGILECVFTPY